MVYALRRYSPRCCRMRLTEWASLKKPTMRICTPQCGQTRGGGQEQARMHNRFIESERGQRAAAHSRIRCAALRRRRAQPQDPDVRFGIGCRHSTGRRNRPLRVGSGPSMLDHCTLKDVAAQ